MTTNPFKSPSPLGLERLSAWVDGELSASEADELAGQWREDAQLRADWHAFHLIGDVLRSEDLASGAQHDADFLHALRTRLAGEPVVLAPSPASPAVRSRKPWMWPSAAAVTLLVVGATVWNSRDTGTPPPMLSLAKPASETATASAVAQEPSLPPVMTVRSTEQGALLRDAEIDRYLAAHQQFVGTSALGMPSGFIRNAAVDGPRR